MVAKGIIIVTFLCNLALIHASSLCCGGENVLLQNKKCADGNKIKQLSCETKVIMEANTTETHINERGYLVFSDDGEVVKPDQYCFTKTEPDGNGIFILCYEEEEQQHQYLMLVNVALSFISVFFIILTIAVYTSVPQLLDQQGICLTWAISGLAFSFIILGIIDLSSYLSDEYCQLLAYLMYTAFMFAFFWLTVVCFHIWKMIVNPHILRFIKRWLLIYHIFGFGGPLILLFLLLAANYSGLNYFHHIHPGIGENKCWFKSPSVTFIYFYGPISVLLCINIMYFCWTTIVLWGQMKHCSEKKTKVLKYRLLLCVKLFFVMGLPWTFEVISAILENSTSKWLWVLPDAFNALQGLLIFLLLVVFRKKAVRGLANKKIFKSLRLPASWKHAQDDECDELEEEISLSGAEEKKVNIPH